MCLPKSVSMNADTVKQPVFGTANEQMHGNVKFVHDNT
nr:MAG TPA: hypothetical protein [Bacteriophage sp.]